MAHPTAYSSRVSIPLPSDTDVRRIIGDGYDPDKTLNFAKMLAGTEDMFAPAVAFVKTLFHTSGIDPKVRQMIILRAAKVLNAPYEWQQNAPMAANVGLTQEEISAAASDGAVTGISPDYVLACKATDELLSSGTLTDQTLSDLLSRYGETVSRKLILVISWFSLLSLFLNGCRVPMETTDKVGSKTSPFG